jgi:hypothetical protein
MRIFFDTEFTGLSTDAKLISIGLVDESGLSEFYAELSDTFHPDECSEFCRKQVLPHLQGGRAQISLAELRAKLEAWLLARGPSAVLVCDSPRDVVQLTTVLPQGLPLNTSVEILGWRGNLKRRILNFRRRIHHQRGYRVHHALDDAKVNRLVLTR